MDSQVLFDIASALNSTKKKEKIDAFEHLTDLLNKEDVIKHLSRNSISFENKMNWDVIFIKMHNAALSLIDENSLKSRSLSDKNIQTLQNVMLLVVQRSGDQRTTLINSNLLVSSVLAVFETEYRCKILGCTYLNFLCKFVLSERRKWEQLKKNSWIGLKNLCQNQIAKSISGTQSIMFLEILCDIIKNSTKNCQTYASFVDLFEFVKNIYSAYKGMGTNYEICLLRLTNILCLQLAIEFRYKVCEFAEEIFDYVISFHRTSNADINILVKDFLMITLSVHNPNGVGEQDKSAYAFKLQKWKYQMYKIYILCLNKVKETLCNFNSSETECDYLNLFVDVSHLVFLYGFENSPDFSDIDEPGAAKKRKYSLDGFSQSHSALNSGKVKLLGLDYGNIITNLLTSDGWFWLQFLELLINKYPQDLKYKYNAVIEVLCQIVCDKKDIVITKASFRCLSSIIDVENFLDLSSTNIKILNDYWNKIGLELIRYLHLETCSEAHGLLRSLIKHSKFYDPAPLIKLYCCGTLPATIDNFKTLSVLCQNCSLPDVIFDENNSRQTQPCYENIREHLLLWLVKGEDKYPPKEYAKLLVVLISNTFEEEIVSVHMKQNILFTCTNINDFCKGITNNYKTTAFENVTFEENSEHPVNGKRSVRVDKVMKSMLIDLLRDRWKLLLKTLTKKMHNFDDELDTLRKCYWFCETILYFLSYTGIVDGSFVDDQNFMEILQMLLHSCTTKSLELLKNQCFDLNFLYEIYNANFHPHIQKIIRESNFTNLALLQFLYEIFQNCKGNINELPVYNNNCINSNSEFSNLIKNNKSVFHFQALKENEKVIIFATEVICQYIILPGSKHSNKYQTALASKIVGTLLENDNEASSNFHLQLVLRVVYAFTKYYAINVSVLNGCLDLLSSIFHKKPKEPDLNITILQVLKDILPLVHAKDDFKIFRKYMKLIDDFRTLILMEKYCGVKTTCKFVENLVELFKYDPTGKWAILEKDGDSYKAFEDILAFFKHSSHEVRMTAALHIGTLFVSNESDNLKVWQKGMLNRLFDVLNNSECLYQSEKGCILEYAVLEITSMSLLSWANIIYKSTFWRKQALFNLVHLSFLKQFNRSEVNDIIKLIFSQLKIDNYTNYFKYNFLHLFSKWADKGYHIQDFPYYILGCKTLDEFIKSYFRPIVMIYAQLGEFNIIDTISAKLKMPVGQILKECYARLMSFILPSRCDQSPDKFHELQKFIEEKLDAEVPVSGILKNFDKIIFHMLRNMHDPAYLSHLCTFYGNIEDDENPYGFTGAQITETIKCLDKHILEKMALESPFTIERILTLLVENMEQSIAYDDKIFAFYKYIFFIEMICKVTKKGRTFEVINNYIIRDVIYWLVGIIRKDDGETLTCMACGGLKKLAEYYLPEFSKIFGEFLPAITTVLTPLIPGPNERKALDVLRFLVCDNYLNLETDILLLDPFPSHVMFNEINQKMEKHKVNGLNTLQDTVQHFINFGNSRNSGYRIEGLKYLLKSLSEKKNELKEMYEQLLRLRGFSEDCKESLIHRLISVLVELTTNKNSEVRMEAAKCLGELGPSDLTTLVLKPENNFLSSEKADSAISKLLKMSLHSLSDLLINENFIVKKASSKALYAILSVRQGKDILRDNIDTYKNFKFILPFQTESVNDLRLKIRKDVFIKNLNESSLWVPENHGKWIVTLVDALLQSLTDSTGIINSCRELIQGNWKFAEDLLPFLLDLFIFSNDEDCTELISKHFSIFFEQNFNYKNKVLPSVNKQSVQCMLKVVDYIRIQRHNEGIYQESSLNVNYLYLAKAALYCSAFFTSIFYAELWSEKKRHGNQFKFDINTICESFPEEGSALTEILRECHSKIGNTDGIHGCGYMHILNTHAEIQHYEHLNNWNMSLLHHDIQLSMGNKEYENGLISCLERCGMYYILNSMAKMSKDTSNLTSLQYKCAAQLSDWSLLNTTSSTGTDHKAVSIDKSYYFALKAFHNDDMATFNNEIQKARKSVLNKLLNCSLESSKNLYLPLAELQRLKELEEFVAEVRNLNKCGLWNVFNKWRKHDTIRCNDFSIIESIFSNRAIFIKIALDRKEKSDISDDLQLMLCQTYYNIIKAARKEKKYEIAIRMLSYTDKFQRVPKEVLEKLKVEKARILWERGDNQMGKFILNYLIRKNEVTDEMKVKSLRIYGDWMVESKSENSREIIQNYYLKSIAQSNNTDNIMDGYASLAKFADSNYEQLNEYLSSPLFEIKQNLINTQQDLASELRQELGWNQNREKRMAYQMAAKQSAIDENEIKNNKAERDSYLNLALKYYLLSLKEGEKYNLFVFRIISMWLSNSNNQDVIQQLKKILPLIPSYKFLCLLPQLLPRMADVCLISDLVERVLQDHPHHTLPLLFALNNSYEDLKYTGDKTNVTTPRVQAAKSILDKFQKNKKLELLISEMKCFCKALIELANYHPPDKEPPGSFLRFLQYLDIVKLKELAHVPVPSINIPYDKNCSYSKIISVYRFEETYCLVGGINLPKRIQCVGSDGIQRPLLVKGRDDLRQDAVMQQVFTIMNSLLSQNIETKKRKLIIRTYKVVPLSQRSGIIEWCENTQPLSLYLTGPDGKSGAHKKFYPDDMAPFECRCMLRNVFAQSGVTNEDKLNVFLDICKRFHPVFRYFFIEKFPAAGVWFERRLAYIHSVATSSMIGYVLGIGDRHVHNILIDNSTAEVIHIDLGIAFEQGKTLPIPETVPFRLSRDIVDGMGLSGVEGDFRISCIKTMDVLRQNKDTILTLLEVLLYDPLYTWTITPEKAYSMQGQTETSSSNTEKSSPDLETNKMAERALIRLKQKLQGTEAGCVTTNVEGQVNYLVQQARDPNNLCRLFHGWQAYLQFKYSSMTIATFIVNLNVNDDNLRSRITVAREMYHNFVPKLTKTSI